MENRNCPAKRKRLTLSKQTDLHGLNFLSLPEDIVSRIIAGITLKEAVRMSTVCSTLRKAWIYHPNLDFDISTVPASSQHNIMQGLKRFIDTVNFVLREHSGLALNRLAVNFELHKEHANDIDGWVSFAISSKARVVVLNFSPYLGQHENNYSFPFHLFNDQNSSHLEVLRLDSVTLDPSREFCGFSNLTTLALVHVLILQDLQYFLLRCPLLEWLTIRRCPELHNLHAAEPLQRLKFLCVQDCAVHRIDLLAPNLRVFEYRGGSKVIFALSQCLKLKTATVSFFIEDNLGYIFTEVPKGLPHIETLRVEMTVNTQIHGFMKAPLIFMHLRNLIMNITFGNVRRLGKNAVLQLAYLLEAAPFLVNLHVDMYCGFECGYRPKKGVVADHPHHNLKDACITGFNGNGGQVALVKYILRNAVQLKRMAVDPRRKMLGQLVEEFEGRMVAESELVPHDRNGVLTILG
ncbi:putative FBD-associated F-box protein At5g56690 [Miscanthus floridulus]|uniref:putative FBD-associated F-box protein At5g56690 n=1 Tax=Miscanthus floridulus TaxID=154761 RepID=UPI003459C679